jgi:hypothetical protein
MFVPICKRAYFDTFLLCFQDWREVYKAGTLSKLYLETWDGFTYPYTVDDVPIDNSTAKNAGMYYIYICVSELTSQNSNREETDEEKIVH